MRRAAAQSSPTSGRCSAHRATSASSSRRSSRWCEQPEMAAALGRNARQAAAAHYSWAAPRRATSGCSLRGETVPIGHRARPAPQAEAADAPRVARSERHVDPWTLARSSPDAPEIVPTGDAYKRSSATTVEQRSRRIALRRGSAAHTKEWFLEAERYRYAEYAPWMAETMEFARHGGEDVLEIGGGMGTDLAQFALHGARVTDLDLSSGHLDAGEGELRRARPAGPLHPARRRDARLRRQHVRRGLQQRRAAPHAEHATTWSARSFACPEARRPRHRR